MPPPTLSPPPPSQVSPWTRVTPPLPPPLPVASPTQEPQPPPRQLFSQQPQPPPTPCEDHVPHGASRAHDRLLRRICVSCRRGQNAAAAAVTGRRQPASGGPRGCGYRGWAIFRPDRTRAEAIALIPHSHFVSPACAARAKLRRLFPRPTLSGVVRSVSSQESPVGRVRR